MAAETHPCPDCKPGTCHHISPLEALRKVRELALDMTGRDNAWAVRTMLLDLCRRGLFIADKEEAAGQSGTVTILPSA